MKLNEVPVRFVTSTQSYNKSRRLSTQNDLNHETGNFEPYQGRNFDFKTLLPDSDPNHFADKEFGVPIERNVSASSESPCVTPGRQGLKRKATDAKLMSNKKIKRGPVTRNMAKVMVNLALQNTHNKDEKTQSSYNHTTKHTIRSNGVVTNLELGKIKIEADCLRPFPKVEPENEESENDPFLTEFPWYLDFGFGEQAQKDWTPIHVLVKTDIVHDDGIVKNKDNIQTIIMEVDKTMNYNDINHRLIKQECRDDFRNCDQDQGDPALLNKTKKGQHFLDKEYEAINSEDHHEIRQYLNQTLVTSKPGQVLLKQSGHEIHEHYQLQIIDVPRVEGLRFDEDVCTGVDDEFLCEDELFLSKLNRQSESEVSKTHNSLSNLGTSPQVKISRSKRIIGIDIGLTQCSLAVWDPKTNLPVIINRDQLNPRDGTPSYVAFTRLGILVGSDAKSQRLRNPCNTFYEITRFLCRTSNYLDHCEFKENDEHWLFKKSLTWLDTKLVVNVKLKRKRRVFKPEALLACLLHKLKRDAEAYFQEVVTEAVISLPTAFGYFQRETIRDAASAVGLNIIQCITHGDAVLLNSEFLNTKMPGLRNIVVFDLGGGSLDVTVGALENGIVEIKSKVSDSYFGGLNFIDRITNHLVNEIPTKHQRHVRMNPKAMSMLRIESERVLAVLSRCNQTLILIENLVPGFDFKTSMLRSTFEGNCVNIFSVALDFVKCALRDAQTQKQDIHEVILVGKCSRIPKIRDILVDFFGVRVKFNYIDSDQPVALGAAIMGEILRDERSDGVKGLQLRTTTSISLGIETAGGNFTTVIKQNTSIPTTKTLMVGSEKCFANGILINVFEGEKLLVQNNKFLGSLICNTTKEGYTNQAQVPKSVVEKSNVKIDGIQVTFDIDVNSILRITVQQKCKKSLRVNSQTKTFDVNQKRTLAIGQENEYQEYKDLKVQVAELIRAEPTEEIHARNELITLVAKMRQKFDEELADRITYKDGQRILQYLDIVTEWLTKNENVLKIKEEYLDRLCYLKDLWDGVKIINN